MLSETTRDILHFFDSGKRPTGSEPERFYHGFVLGLMVELADHYVITSNRESGFGRYDVLLEPRCREDDAIILEFKVQDKDEEKFLSDTVQAALQQINEKRYAAVLEANGTRIAICKQMHYIHRPYKKVTAPNQGWVTVCWRASEQ